MYYPVLKNKLNEIKALKNAYNKDTMIPIIEIVETKKDIEEEFIDNLLKSFPEGMKRFYFDIASYLDNHEIYEKFDLLDEEMRFNFIKNIYTKSKAMGMDPVPVISFYYLNGTKKEAFRENIRLVKRMEREFDEFVIRLYPNQAFGTADGELIMSLYDFYEDELCSKVTMIIDTTSISDKGIVDAINFIHNKMHIDGFVLVGETIKGVNGNKNGKYKHLKNNHLERFNKIKKDCSDSFIEYGDFSILDKKPSPLEIDPDKGFAYFPYIKYTEPDGSICMFTAKEAGKYYQYKDVATNVSLHKGFSKDHCPTCTFIQKVSAGEVDKFKSGSVWKHRMITHHMVMMSELL